MKQSLKMETNNLDISSLNGILNSPLILYLKFLKKNINSMQTNALKKLDIYTVADLLYFAPSRYIDYSFNPNLTQDDAVNGSIESKIPIREGLSFFGYITHLKSRKSWQSKTPMSEAILEVPSNALLGLEIKKIQMFWFNQAYISRIYKEGEKVLISGKGDIKTDTKGNKILVFANPYIERLKSFPETQTNLFNQHKDIIEDKILPIYRETTGITSRFLFECIKRILSNIHNYGVLLSENSPQSDLKDSDLKKTKDSLNTIQNNTEQKTVKQNILKSSICNNNFDPLPLFIRKELNLPDIYKTFLFLHTPRNVKDYQTAQKRLLFEEIFYLQLNIQKERLTSSMSTAYKINIEKSLLQEFYKRENIIPTKAQDKVIKEILKDLNRNNPMQRLLEGDVGSGKTFVAASAALATIHSKRDQNLIGSPLQVAYLAPTEILAKQQFESFIKYFKHTKISIGYLSGKEAFKFPSKINNEQYTKISKPQLSKWIQSGEISVLIGTHSIAKKSVIFKDLALIIIDEQHRFGVKTRSDLAHKKGDMRTEIPHLLSMTATPIPRTLALSIFGDLDLSIIDELPKGRKPVITSLARYGEEDEIFKKVEQQIQNGRQIFVICTKIEKDEESNRKSVESEVPRLQKIFKKYKVVGLHGKTDKSERDKIMNDFKDNKINILVSTSIIEVGVNIPNASIMIIQDADRFGLSQLHQMRGRVGRGEYDSECILFSNSENEDSIKRLKIFEKTTDGFALAEQDLSTRGPGGILTGRQSGLSDMAMEAIKNLKLVELARKYAKDIIDKDPLLHNFGELLIKLEKIKESHLE